MGHVLSLASQSFPPKSHFNAQDIPDLTGKVMLVTGANTGIGKETAKALLEHNAKVYVAARNEEKSLQAIEDLKAQTGKEAIFLKLDLGDLASVKSAANEFMSKEEKLDVLFNNAGVMFAPIELTTTQGYDLQFGTNVVGHYYFTKLLIPSLIAGAKSSPGGKSRVVHTSSSTSCLVGGLDFNTFKDSPARKRQSTYRLYCQSKLGNVVVATEFAKRYGDQGIVSTSLNPGNIRSDIQRYAPKWRQSLTWYLIHPTPLGALTQLWAGTSPEGANFNGKYLVPWAREGPCNPVSQDPELGKALWDWLEEQVADI